MFSQFVEFTMQDVETFLYRRVIVFICVCGVLGNLLNLIVLTRKGLQRSMDRMEKSAHVGKWKIIHKEKVSENILCFRLQKSNVFFHTATSTRDLGKFKKFIFGIASEHEHIFSQLFIFHIKIKFNQSTNHCYTVPE